MPKNKSILVQKKYTENKVLECIQAIKAGMSLYKASLVFGIPRTTIRFRMSDKFVKFKRGPTPILSDEEEQQLVQWLVDSYGRGFPRKKGCVILSAKDFLDEKPRKNPFSNNTPGDGWYKAFVRRHPILEEKTEEPKKEVFESDVQNWFTKITIYLTEQSLDHILQDPSKVCVAEETCFKMSTNGRVLVDVKSPVQSDFKIIVMTTVFANGNITPPMIIYPNERKAQKVTDSIPKGWNYQASMNGMNAKLFANYIRHVLYPFLVKNNSVFPFVLFVDGSTTHMTFAVNQVCVKLRIILIALYPNATTLTDSNHEPLLRRLENSWIKSLEELKTQGVKKEHFAPILEKVMENCLESKTYVDGFKQAGIYPWNFQIVKVISHIPSENSEPSNNAQTCSDIIDSTVINYKTFKEIIGPEMLQECEQYNSKERSKYVRVIHELWSAFQNQALRMPESLAFDIDDIYTMSFKEEVSNETSDEDKVLQAVDEYLEKCADPLEIKEEENMTDN